MVERILQIIEYKELNKLKFYKKTGLSNGFLDKVKDIGGSKIDLILKCFPDISPDWLLSGKGEMLRFTSENNIDSKGNTLQKDKLITALEQSNQLLLDKIETLQGNNNLTERVIKLEEFKDVVTLKFKIDNEIEKTEASVMKESKQKLVERNKG